MNYNKLKKMIAGVLAGAVMATAPGFYTLTQAASKYYIWFDAVDDATTTIIQGDRVNAKASIPPGHEFDVATPFDIRILGIAAKSGLLTVTPNSRNYYTITASKDAAYGNEAAARPDQPFATTYTLNAKLTAKLTDGDGIVQRPADLGVPDATDTFYSLKVTSKKELAITTDSAFTFEVSSGENTGSLAFGKVTNATGELLGMEGKQVLLDTYTKQGNNRTITVSIEGSLFDIVVTMPEDIKAGTKFTAKFRLQDINPLILTVVTPKWTVDEVARSIKDNPTNPNVTDKSKIPYIGLSSGDTLSNISKNFDLLARLEKFNSEVHIDWRWEPIGDYADVVEFGADGRKTRVVTLNPRKEDVKGYLVGQVDYTLKEPYSTGGETIRQVLSDEVKIPITILGTGDPPELRPLTQVVGSVTSTISKLPDVMDVYDNSVAAYPVTTTYPHQFTASLFLGQGRGRAEKTVITASGITPNAVALYVENSPVAYEFGTELVNTDPVGGKIKIDFVAKTKGQVMLTFDFYIRNSKNQLVKSDKPIKLTLVVKDTTPRDFANLENVILKSEGVEDAYPPRGEIDFGFQTGKYLYSIALPNKASTISLTPIVFDNMGTNTQIKYEISGEPPIASGTVTSGNSLPNPELVIPMPVNLTRNVTMTVTAENGREQLYIFSITRRPPDRDSSLKSLRVADMQAKELLTDFVATKTQYQINVPYKTRWVSVEAIANSLWSMGITFSPELIKQDGLINQIFGEKSWVRLTHPQDEGAYLGEKTTVIKATVQAEDQTLQTNGEPLFATTYTVNVTRLDPSSNNHLASLAVKTKQGQEIAFADNQVFKKEVKNYALNIPYSVTELELFALPDDLGAQNVLLTMPDGVTVKETKYNGDGQAMKLSLPVPISGDTETEFSVFIAATAENGQVTEPLYHLLITRNPPDQDNTLTNLELKDQQDKTVSTFSFNPETLTYKVTVPYETEQVKVIPTARSPLAKIKVNGKDIVVQRPYFTLSLKAGETGQVKVEIFAEDVKAQPRVYELSITRSLPNNDARLKSLVVTGITELDPKFIPNKTQYRTTMPTTSKGITITAEPNSTFSTMMINGQKAQSGVATGLITPVEEKSEILIEVTAQDGKTKMVYQIQVTNENLVVKSTNADLSSLEVRDGVMSPRFKAGITDYEVAVKDETSFIDILPTAANGNATVRVYSESKELGDYYGNYSDSLRDGENVFTIEVTAQDDDYSKEYTLIVYRKDEEKQGNLKPITADMINFEQSDTILVDITKYPIIAADVFNTLKEKYPNKIINFQGNDYSLQMRGKDMQTLIPHTNVYDFSLSFSSPFEEEIWDLIYESKEQYNGDLVFVHFKHHGQLPGPMVFSLSLGRKYANEYATWNYYNEERDRIDYYGTLKTNARGTLILKLTHMSTYLTSFHGGIPGAEMKTESPLLPDWKPNPNTGTEV